MVCSVVAGARPDEPMLVKASPVPVEVKHTRQSHVPPLNILLLERVFMLLDQLTLTALSQSVLLTTSEILN